MLAYLLKRILLMIPTLIGVITLTFVVIQFVPGGPVEQMMLEMKGRGGAAEASGGGAEYRGRRGVDPDKIKEIQALCAVRLRQAADRALFPDAQALCKV